MRSERHRRLLYWLAFATAATALLPIVVGALVTTRDAGMAFRDWPTSDGQGMFSYPWLKSAGDKFLEHGHRLAGMVIGCVSIIFAVATWLLEPRRWVRYGAAGVLLAVIVQGILGGGRVLADERALALSHGAFAAAVFTFMASMALVQSRSWNEPARRADVPNGLFLKTMTLVTPALILVQYSLGGLVRHMGRALYEHLGMAGVVLVAIILTAIAAWRTQNRWLRRPGLVMAALVLAQIALGAAAWITRFGFPSWGYVAVQGSNLQTAVRTGHTVLGMFLFMTSVVLLLRVLRVDWLGRRRAVRSDERLPAAVHATATVRLKGSLS